MSKYEVVKELPILYCIVAIRCSIEYKTDIFNQFVGTLPDNVYFNIHERDYPFLIVTTSFSAN